MEVPTTSRGQTKEWNSHADEKALERQAGRRNLTSQSGDESKQSKVVQNPLLVHRKIDLTMGDQRF